MAIDPKKQIGRPTSYRKEYCEALIEHMKQGLSFEAFGAIVHVSRRTLQNWVHAFPEFAEAKEIAESYARLVWEREGQKLISFGGGPGSAAVWIFTMRNRFGWRNDPEKDPDTDGAKEAGKAQALDALSDEELEEQIQAKLIRLGKVPT